MVLAISTAGNKFWAVDVKLLKNVLNVASGFASSHCETVAPSAFSALYSAAAHVAALLLAVAMPSLHCAVTRRDRRNTLARCNSIDLFLERFYYKKLVQMQVKVVFYRY